MDSIVEISVNGKKKQIKENTTVDFLLKTLGISNKVVIVELNETILKNEQLSQTKIKKHDSLELIQLMGGG